jgi:hypothetical protein
MHRLFYLEELTYKEIADQNRLQPETGEEFYSKRKAQLA